ncbi:hypothetical protein DFJ74DRAFT_719410 [Hyaloraphidium curvatum]|nr:hypothetical protein DFJ74DRAFT_719410 [Hyaloraphidium curvatum]
MRVPIAAAALLPLLLACPAAAFVSSGRLVRRPAGQAPPASALVVTVGIYVRKVYDFDPTTDTWQCTFDLWMSWRDPNGAAANFSDPATPNPTATLYLSNAIDIGSTVLAKAFDAPLTSDNVTFAMLFRANSRFGRAFDLQAFPVDKHSLAIVVEDSTNPADAVWYLPDVAESGFDRDFSIPGWVAGDLSAAAAVRDYGSGLGVFPRGTLFPAAVFAVNISRGNFLLAWQILPLVFVLCLSWLSLIVSPDRADSRIALGTTALLTAVFLQQAALSLFNRTYLVVLDQIYVMAYIFFTLNLAVILLDEFQYSAAEMGWGINYPPKPPGTADGDADEKTALADGISESGAQPPDGDHVLLVPPHSPEPPDSAVPPSGTATGDPQPPPEPPHRPWFPLSPPTPAPSSNGGLPPPKKRGRKCAAWFAALVMPPGKDKTEALRGMWNRDAGLALLEIVATIVTTSIVCATAPGMRGAADEL